MRTRRMLLLLILLTGLCVSPLPIYAAASLELYGTFDAIGVVVTLDPGDDPDLSRVCERRSSG